MRESSFSFKAQFVDFSSLNIRLFLASQNTEIDF